MSPEEAQSATDLIRQLGEGSEQAEHILLHRAGSGDLAAQRALASCLAFGSETPSSEAMFAAEVMARLAASHGDAEHRRYLAGLLAVCAGHSRDSGHEKAAIRRETDCMAILTHLADEGDEMAAETIVKLADGFSPEAMEAAKRLIASVARPSPPDAPGPIVRTSPAQIAASTRLRWWMLGQYYSVRFYFSDIGYALAALGRALIGRGY